MENTLTLSAQCDTPFLSVSEVTKRKIRYAIQTGPGSDLAQRLPLNICLALDKSSSMSGTKMQYLKKAAIALIDGLQERDTVSVLAFDGGCELIMPATTLFREQKEELKRRIAAIKTGNGTALTEAFLRGAGLVADHLLIHGVNELLLVTDGRGNHPAHPDMKLLATHANELRKRGVTISAFGIGEDVKPYYLTPLATYGGGSYAYLPDVDATLFAMRQNQLVNVVARDTKLNLVAPVGVSMRLLGDWPHQSKGRALRICPGNLSRGQAVPLFVEINAVTGKEGVQVPLRSDLTYMTNNGERQTLSKTLNFVYTDHISEKTAPRDMSIRQEAAYVRMAYAVQRVLCLADERRYSEAETMLRAAIERNRPYLNNAATADYNRLLDSITQNILPTDFQQHYYEAYRNERRM
jgi:Ca-activated chloride channel family protein